MVDRHGPKISFAKTVFENFLISNYEFDVSQTCISKNKIVKTEKWFLAFFNASTSACFVWDCKLRFLQNGHALLANEKHKQHIWKVLFSISVVWS